MSDHRFELLLLVFIFVFGTIMLAIRPNDEMARWIEGGLVVSVIARGLGGSKPNDPSTNGIPKTVEATNPNVTKEQ